ncbi:sugar-binding transcriptional regulator [Trueperella sp. LYQ143]|uniref:sugar-binding transcriptional regulator n=1 Tax=unclassified Trueperella TaxID=2630174 RepID=UPI003983BFB1
MAGSGMYLSPRDVQAIDAAKLYYAGMNQAEVAQRLHVSRPTVSKLLAHAEKRGFVHVQVLDPREQDETLVETLTQRYNLLELTLVNPVRSGDEALRRALGEAGARLLSGLIRDGDILGVVPSRTVAAISHCLERVAGRDLTVVQVSHGLTDPRATSGQPTTIQRIAAAFNAEALAMPVPTFVTSITVRNRLMRRQDLRRVLDTAARARIVLYTVGDLETNRHLVERSPLSPRDRATLFDRAVGDICSRFVDANGRICLPDLNSRTLGISLPELRHKEQKVLVAGGASKADVIRAALEHGYANRLVTDVNTARAIVYGTV